NAAPPMAMARGYAAFANGGYLVEPYFIERIEDRDGQVVFEAAPRRACIRCPQRLGATPSTQGGSEGFDLSSAAPAPTAEAVPLEQGPPASGETLLADRAVDERTAFLVNSLLRDVVRRGT